MRPIVFVLAIATACDAYDRDLGTTPFLCGPDEPRCPSGYECMTDGISGDEVCVSKSGSVNGGGSCANDSAEPNDSLATATPTSIGMSNTFTLDNLSICPATDKDAFSIMVATASTAIEVLVVFDPANVPLHADLLSQNGVPIATSSMVGADMARVVGTNLPIGQYYAAVSGPSTGPAGVNTYKVTINTN